MLKKVLFVDDTLAIREFMEEIFTEYSISFLIFSTITEARLHIDEVECIITDGNVEVNLDGDAFALELYEAGRKVMLYSSLTPDKNSKWPFKFLRKSSISSDFKTVILPWLTELS